MLLCQQTCYSNVKSAFTVQTGPQPGVGNRAIAPPKDMFSY